VPGMTMDWTPVRPERVCEVSYTQVDGHRFRHPAKLRRWRPDRDPRSCRLDQLDAPTPPAADILEPDRRGPALRLLRRSTGPAR
jgi:ATP-dependent DNA ligase